jgi:hypothetical protein
LWKGEELIDIFSLFYFYCVSDLICNGKILMRDRKIEGEEKIKKEATKRAKNLTKF